MSLRRRVVFDTNIVLSALVFGGPQFQRLRAGWHDGCWRPLVCQETTRELIRVLAYPKFRLSPDEQMELLSEYLPHSEVVHVPDPAPWVPPCRDPHDLPFLQLAVAGRAQTLVSGDKDLLALTSHLERDTGCVVLNLDDFLKRYP